MEEPRDRLENGIALCLSGGGYRAMLFHVGALIRLNELRYLPKLDRISSVSGGSITAAALAANWGQLRFDDDGVAAKLGDQLVDPVRTLAGRTVDRGSVWGGIFTRGTVAEKVAGAYRKHLLGTARLDELPDRPRFVFNATSVQTGALWRFSKPYMADYKVGLIPEPKVELAVAAAASSAFPPVLSPLRLKLNPDDFSLDDRGPLHREPFTTEAVLSDGGVYDNLGLETAWKRYRTVLVSDGGGQLSPDPKPKSDWAHHAVRVGSVVDNQVRSLRKRQTIAGFERGDRKGTYWGIRSDIDDYDPPDGGLPCPSELTLELAKTKTRLRKMDRKLQERLINWGYAICDAAMRTWVEPGGAKPADFPYPQAGVG
ncbi:MAG: patatin-like phospholipase family protein [Chloroflexota bacterium]|nr:patatin-like phospholipase family protein [Chloroflexota bacterium]